MEVQTENCFLQHSELTDPGDFSAAITALPQDAARLTEIVGGLFVHSDYLHLYGLGDDAFRDYSRKTRSLAECIGDVQAAGGLELEARKPYASRLPATCRDYAVVLCGLLREKSFPARVRCGFARYFLQGRFEDHWICEYAEVQGWRICDAQLDDEHRAYLGIDFDPAYVPREQFWTAERAWMAWRRGDVDAAAFGHGEAVGPRFLAINLARDFLALTGREMSVWDAWRQALPWCAELTDAQVAVGDALATAIADGADAGKMPALPEEVASEALRPFW